ncbi:mitochondrial DUF3501 domain-containing protein, partial [Andalucia godoyi]
VMTMMLRGCVWNRAFGTFEVRALNRRTLSPGDYIGMEKYAPIRKTDVLPLLRKLRSERRLLIGPHVSFCFENYDTMWIQAHEMVHVEKGNEKQFAEECESYGPLVPDGSSLSGCLLIEIDNPVVRAKKLREYGHIENHVFWDFGDGNRVQASPLNEERTTPDGKTSAVHFLKFTFSEQALNSLFKDAKQMITIEHPKYAHSTALSEVTLAALRHDVDQSRSAQ